MHNPLMTTPPLRIVFFGTAGFAVPSLEAVAALPHQIVGVVTAPDAWRRKIPFATPVRRWAQTHGIPSITPPTPRDPQLLEWLRQHPADLFLVIAYKKLPRAVWAMPPKGTVNLHASLLPDYRGAAPIHHALIRSETETGVTTFYIDDAIDTGDIIFQQAVSIDPEDTFGTLHDRLARAGADLVVRTLSAIAEGTAPRIRQTMRSSKKAPRLTREFTRIQWDQPAERLYHFIRGLSPVPGAWTTFGGRRVKVLFARPQPAAEPLLPGHFKIDRQTLLVGTAVPDRPLRLERLQLEGKRAMTAEEVVRGRLLPPSGQFN